jgi:hypothetical protein
MNNKQQDQNYNLLTANVGNPTIAKSILEGILFDCEHKITTIDALAVLLQAIADKENLVLAQDFIGELQDFLFVQTSEAYDARVAYVEAVKKGKTYNRDNPYLIG